MIDMKNIKSTAHTYKHTYSVSTKNKATTFYHSVIKPQINALIFWHSDVWDNCEFAYDDVVLLACVMLMPGKMFQTSYRFGNEQNSQTVKPQIQKFW